MSKQSENLRRSSRVIARPRATSESDDCHTPLLNKSGTPGRRLRPRLSSSESDSTLSRLQKPDLEKDLESIEENVQIPKGENLRRSSRVIARARATSESDDCHMPLPNKSAKGTPGRRGRPRLSNAQSDSTLNRFHKPDLEKDLEGIEENVQTPKELFDENDVSANRYYGFHTPPKKNAMVQKAMLSRTPATPHNSAKLPVLKIIVEKTQCTPSSKKNDEQSDSKIAAQGRQIRQSLCNSDSESVSENSEYIPSSDDEVTSDENEIIDSDGDHSEEQDEEQDFQAGKIPIPLTTSASRGKSKKSIAYSDFHMKSDDYFTSQSGKILTSDRTLARLKNPRLNEEKLQEIIKNENHISRTHAQCICRLTENCKDMFPMWYHIMEEGYSLLLHGLGSKRKLINDFHKEIISDHPTLVVNGFFPSLTVKDILDSIITELLELESPTNPNEAFALIEDNLKINSDDRLYLLIHNIDGANLRSNKAQDSLSRLAAISNVRLLASVDHIKAPLLWDNVKSARYNFYWWDATTLLPYEAETSYESSLLVQHSGTLALSSLHNVFQSLTTNTKAIYILLVKHQLENGKNHHYPGMAFKDLYRASREGFLVSSDLALRAQLTEFIDHKLVRTKRNMDGTEYLTIPLDNALLRQFLEQHDQP